MWLNGFINVTSLLPSTVEVNKRYVQFYNAERPNQAITCGNQPPYVKFPEKPDLTSVPESVDPDRWLTAQTGKTYKKSWMQKGVSNWATRPTMFNKAVEGKWL